MAVADGGKTSHIKYCWLRNPSERLISSSPSALSCMEISFFGRKLTAGNTKGLPRTLPEIGRAFGKP